MTNNFNFIAPVYDSIAKLVFGKSIRASQLTFISEIKEGEKILIFGGGSGWILKELDHLGLSIKVEYVESSSRMIELAKSKGPYGNIEVNYVLNDSYCFKRKFDGVITAFFLDVFNQKSLDQWMINIGQMLKSDGIWLQTDFVKGRHFWQRLLLNVMYSFFKLTCGIQGSKLPDFDKYFQQLGFFKQQSKYYYGKMIEASLYRRL